MTESMALAPKMTILSFFLSGSTCPLFCSKTMLLRAMSRANCLWAVHATTFSGIFVQGFNSSGSRSPSSKRAMSRRRRLRSRSASLMSPRLTAAGKFLYSDPHSTSVPASTACAEASALSFAVLCHRGRKSRIAPQSLVISPSNPHSSRRICCS